MFEKLESQIPLVGIWQPISAPSILRELCSFHDLAGFDTAGTDLDPSVSASGQLYTNRLKIWVESPTGLVIRMRNVVTELRPFAAYVASLSHFSIASK